MNRSAKPCLTCGGSGEVLSNTLPPDDRYPGAFSCCIGCKGTGRPMISASQDKP